MIVVFIRFSYPFNYLINSYFFKSISLTSFIVFFQVSTKEMDFLNFVIIYASCFEGLNEPNSH